MKWESGVKYECIMSASPAYRVGDVVQCYQNDKGWKVVKGRDGIEDLCSMLVSSFKKHIDRPSMNGVVYVK